MLIKLLARLFILGQNFNDCKVVNVVKVYYNNELFKNL